MSVQQTRWMIDLGHVPIPKSWFAQKEVKIEAEDGKKRIMRCKKLDSQQMIKKLRRGIAALLRNKYVETRAEAYEILKERNFLPIIAGYKLMSWQRFSYYYHETITSVGIEKHRGSKISFIKNHYKTWSQESLANHLDCKVIYIQQTISKINRGLIK